MSKGGENERKVAKFLTKWLTGKDKPYMYWRQDASGGLATVHAENTHLTGDITHLHPDAKFLTDIFSIECKTGYPATSYWQHFTTAKFAIEEFWTQSIRDANKAQNNPMLIYRKKGRKWIVGINNYVRDKLLMLLVDYNSITVTWGSDIEPCHFYDFDAFWTITPQEMKDRLWQH